ncbi:PREDICTED: translation initiation factor IF-2-like [Capra hircus]|uniref:translation initiation factor IF-2-like n=1 Tax=Capra hircus TaxID=9925 RepID=UPI000846865C|nr:PREDICTED: translation initiation factor IF-2-like [Capra hircus]
MRSEEEEGARSCSLFPTSDILGHLLGVKEGGAESSELSDPGFQEEETVSAAQEQKSRKEGERPEEGGGSSSARVPQVPKYDTWSSRARPGPCLSAFGRRVSTGHVAATCCCSPSKGKVHLRGAPLPIRPSSSRASAWAPRSESLSNGGWLRRPRAGETRARVVSSGAAGRGRGRTGPPPSGPADRGWHAARLPGSLKPARPVAAEVPLPCRDLDAASPSLLPSRCAQFRARQIGHPAAAIAVVAGPPAEPRAGHEEPRGAARRQPGCAHTSPAADGDMSRAHGVRRRAASPSRRRPADRPCPGE